MKSAFRALIVIVACVAAAGPAHAQAERRVPGSQAEMQLSFAPIVREVAPAVVNVYATRIAQQQRSPFNDPFFERFFGGQSPFSRGRPQQSQSLGSGVIVDPEGIILTNNHVVAGATDIRVAMTDGREYRVELVLADSATDLAVLRVENPQVPFPAVIFADSDHLEVGDLVLAIGNPFGVGQTVTSGIVSALARTGLGITDYQFFIQTDAAINPGNSGGALVDVNGRLVGINTAIFTRSGGSQGIGFAIPANMARVIANAGQSGGAIVRPWFGAQLQPLNTDLAASLGLETPRGALIADVAAQSPADQAGLAPGDVVVSADGIAISDPEALNYRIATKPVGDTAEIVYLRDGRQATATVAMREAPSATGEQVTISGQTRFAGATAMDLNPALAQEMGLAFSAQGVIITEVEAGSPASQLGVRVGDIILNLNGVDIADARTFAEVAGDRPGTWQIVLQRGGSVIRSYVSG